MIVYGTQRLKIKSYTEHHLACPNCKTFDIDVKVFQHFGHVYFMPLFPRGYKQVDLRCNHCYQPIRNETIIKEYEKKSKVPLYYYSVYLGIALFIGFFVLIGIQSEKEKPLFVSNPLPGDVYLVKEKQNDSTFYYFGKVSHMSNDTVFIYQNNLVYLKYVSRLNREDFFKTDLVYPFTKKELQEMLQKDKIVSVYRDYGSAEGFDRVEKGN